jgi:ATP-dependent DNA helicase RecG
MSTAEKRETEHREFKKSLAELKAGLISIASILNKHGRGELWFGIRNDGKAVGLDATDKTLRDVSQAIAAHI